MFYVSFIEYLKFVYIIHIMSATSVDAEIKKYLPFLGNDEKRSLLVVIKSFLNLRKDKLDDNSVEQYNKEIEEAMARIYAGIYVSHDDLENEMGTW